jgi:EmrB/QacA subfamily drug resistance transporter
MSTVAMGRSRRGLVLAACMMATFTAAIEGTIVATAMPTIVNVLGGGELYSWVFSAFLLAQAVTIPIYGRLADLYGRKSVFVIGSGLFLIGSALCGLANSIVTLIVFRAVQGCGAGAVQPIAYTIVGDIYTPVERARIQGMLSATFGVAAISGPLVGTLLVHAGTWRFVFWANIPIVIAAIAMVSIFLHADVVGRRHRIDVVGALWLVVGIGALIAAADRWREMGWLDTSIALAGGAAALVLLGLHERHAPEPMLPPILWRNPIIVIGGFGALSVGMTIMSVTAFIPPFVQAAMGRDAGAAGTVIGTMLIVWMLGSIVGGRLMVRIPYRVTGCVGAALIIAGAALLVALTPRSSLGLALAGVSILAFGLGFCNTTWIVSVQTRVRFEERGSATSVVMFMRFLGQAFGAAIGGIILSFGFRLRSTDAAGALGQLLDPHAATLLGAADMARLEQATADALRGVFVMTAVLGCITLLLAWRLPKGVCQIVDRATAPEANSASMRARS